MFAARYQREDDTDGEQVRVGAIVGDVRTTHCTRTDRQAISVGEGLGAAHRVRSDVEQTQIELRFERRIRDQQQQQCEKVR